MNPDLQHAARFLGIIEQQVARMDDWGYSLALRFEAYDRAHGEARMVRGGHFLITCGFRVVRAPERWLLFTITVGRDADRWLVRVEVEEGDEERTRFHWESPPIAASSLDEVSLAFDRAFEILDATIMRREIVDVFKLVRPPTPPQ